MTSEGPLNVRASVEGTVGRVVLAGELDLDRAGALADELGGLAGQGVTSVIVDVAGLSFIDSSGLRAFLTARDQLTDAGATLELVNLSPAVERVLDMTGTRIVLTKG